MEQLAAQELANQTASPETVELLQPLIEAIRPIMGTVSAVVGGIFGLYLIFIIARLYYERRKVRLLRNINYDLDYLNQHFNLPYSHEKKIPKKIVSLEEFRRMKEEREKRREEKLKEKKNKLKEKEKKRKLEKPKK